MKDKCPGCGSEKTLEELQKAGFVACCPDRPGVSPLIDFDGVQTPKAKK